jgi:hypothetical protein
VNGVAVALESLRHHDHHKSTPSSRRAHRTQRSPGCGSCRCSRSTTARSSRRSPRPDADVQASGFFRSARSEILSPTMLYKSRLVPNRTDICSGWTVRSGSCRPGAASLALPNSPDLLGGRADSEHGRHRLLVGRAHAQQGCHPPQSAAKGRAGGQQPRCDGDRQEVLEHGIQTGIIKRLLHGAFV